MQCIQCGVEFEGRGDKLTCSGRCKKAQQRLKGTNKGDITKGDKIEGVPVMADDPARISEAIALHNKIFGDVGKPANYGPLDCQCLHCQGSRARGKTTVNHGAWKPLAALGPNEVNRVSLPGDADYAGCV